MVDGKTGFVRYDLAITKKMHQANILNCTYPVLDPDLDPILRVEPESAPNFKDLQDLVERVGRPYKWHLRQEYNERASVREITKELKQPTSKRFSFWSGKKEVGGAIIANIEPDVGRIFAKAHDEKRPIDLDPSMADRSIEIYKIGLFPEYTKRGWGRYFLPDLLGKLFDDASKPEVVYLNTRDSNHSGVIKFYTGFNMNVIHARSFPNDLISEEEYQTRKSGMMRPGRKNDGGAPFVPALA